MMQVICALGGASARRRWCRGATAPV